MRPSLCEFFFPYLLTPDVEVISPIPVDSLSLIVPSFRRLVPPIPFSGVLFWAGHLSVLVFFLEVLLFLRSSSSSGFQFPFSSSTLALVPPASSETAGGEPPCRMRHPL